MSDDYIDWEKAARKYNIEIGEKDATIARLEAENAALKEKVERLKALENKMGSGWALVEYEELQKRLAAAENELDELRKVVWLLWEYEGEWIISGDDAKANNLDIAALQKGMGK